MVAAMVREGGAAGLVTSIVTLSGRPGRIGEAVRPWANQLIAVRPTPSVSMLVPVALARTIRRTQPDVVHLHSGAWYKPALAARLARARVVIYTEHGREHADPTIQRAVDRMAARLTDAVVAVSDRLRDYLVQRVRVPACRVRTIGNGVDTTFFSPVDTLAGRPADAAGAVIGTVGRLEPVKGHDVLIEAFARLVADGMFAPPPSLVICGDGSWRPALMELARARGVAHLVRFAGWTTDPRTYYREFDVFVLPSRSEGTSVSLLEAMSCGVPPVVTSVGSNAAILGPALAGQVVPPEDPEALAARIADTLGHPAQLNMLRKLARERVSDAFSLGATIGAYRALYDELLGPGRSG